MTDEVAALVLRNNQLQTLALSLALRRGAGETGFAIVAMLDSKTLPRQATLHQPGKTGVIVDIKQRGVGRRCHVADCGT